MFLVAGCDGPEELELVEEAFDEVPVAVQSTGYEKVENAQGRGMLSA